MQLSYQQHGYNLKDPNICPHCHIVVNPHEIWHVVSKDIENTLVVISAWQCSNLDCVRVFIVSYKYDGKTFLLDRYLNGLPKGPDWPKPIADLKNGNLNSAGGYEKSKFCNTYLQSLVAEHNGLNELAGMGYRKAIEYLVKDWAIQNKPEDKIKIEGLWLGAVIKDYYSGDLKEILERATWLGNDQAHYNKIFEEYDIDILKELIDLIMVELDRQYKMKHYIDTIQKRK